MIESILMIEIIGMVWRDSLMGGENVMNSYNITNGKYSK